jgi:hypothetical protein
MATFFVLPPRERLEMAVSEFVDRILPGLSAPPAVCDALLAALELEANRPDDVYFVHREELTGMTDVMTDLTVGFGAEPGDVIVEIGGPGSGQTAAPRRSSIPGRMSDMPMTR